jgi:hypothetical protein
MSSLELRNTNRRAVARRPPKRTTKARCIKGSLGLGSNLAVQVNDISETGARLVLQAPVDMAKEIEITLCGPARKQIVKLPARVMWCADNGDGTYMIGARFQRRIPYRDYLEIISQDA